MPSDFTSTALSPPYSPNNDGSPLASPTRPSWQRTQSSLSQHTRSDSFYGSETYIQRAIYTATKLNRRAIRLWQKMSPFQRTAFVAFNITAFTLAILFFVYNHAILDWLRPKADAWAELPGGWAILWTLTFLTAFPPVIGYSTCVSIAGFVYGFPMGWPIVATANVLGSLLSFLLFRYLLSSWAQRCIASDSRFNALSLVLQNDGLKLLIMIRLCPLPYSLSNGALSTFHTISPLNFALATAIATPKLLIHVFIGSRLKALAGDMDTGTKVINWASIVLGGVLGVATGWWVYQRTQARARQLEAEERTKIGTQGRRAGGRVRGSVGGEMGLEHPDAFVDDLGEEEGVAGGEEQMLRRSEEGGEEVDFEWGDDEDEPYVDEPGYERSEGGDVERGFGLGNGKAGGL